MRSALVTSVLIFVVGFAIDKAALKSLHLGALSMVVGMLFVLDVVEVMVRGRKFNVRP